jgi:hypothetical protein
MTGHMIAIVAFFQRVGVLGIRGGVVSIHFLFDYKTILLLLPPFSLPLILLIPFALDIANYILAMFSLQQLVVFQID